MLKKLFLFVGIFSVSITFLFLFDIKITDAALITADGMIGHYDINGNPDYTAFALPTNEQGLALPQASCINTTTHYLFVTDKLNSRVLAFSLDSNNNPASTTASYVLGHSNFYSYDTGTTQSTLNNPTGIACDSNSNRLFVADGSNNRVMIFDVSTITNGENASNVLGQFDFTHSTASTTQNGLSSPQGLTFDPTNNRLFVTDKTNNRVMVFNVATSTITDGKAASNVLGQTTFTVATSGKTSIKIKGPIGADYDSVSDRLFVADSGNNRVMVFNVATSTITDGKAASNVLGQTDFVSSVSDTTQSNLSSPRGLSFDSASNRLFVADNTNNRVMVFNVATSTITDGSDALNVLGQTDFVSSDPATTQNRLEQPLGLSFASTTQSLFVADSGNSRVMIFNVATSTITNGKNASSELGHTDPSGSVLEYTSWDTNNRPNSQTAYNVHGAVLDTKNHRMFVCEYNDLSSSAGRVLVYPLDANDHIAKGTADYVLGWDDFYSFSDATSVVANKLSQLVTCGAYDSTSDRLFISDTDNNRVMVFNVAPSTIANGANAINVLGQANFTSPTAATTQAGLSAPKGLSFDSASNRLFVADSGNNRVVVFNVATSTITNGENASYVWGQADFTHSTAATTQAGLSNPVAVSYDSTNGRLFVADNTNNRVMAFNATSTIANGANAINVLGQTDFTSATAATTQAKFSSPYGVTYNSNNDQLFVADRTNMRVMLFNVATSTITNGENASNVLGQSDFTSTTNTNLGTQNGKDGSGYSEYGIYDPTHNRYFDSQYYPDRVMEFPMVNITTTSFSNATADSLYSANIGTEQSQATLSFSVYSGSLPTGLSLNASTGVISGTPTVSGTNTFTIEADDTFSSGSFFDRVSFSIQVVSALPVANTQSASSINATTATLNGKIETAGGENATTIGFEYGLTNSYGTIISNSGSYNTGTFASNIANLTCNTTYHFRSFATNSVGTASSTDGSFLTSVCPINGPVFSGSSSSFSNYTEPRQQIIYPNGTIIYLDEQRPTTSQSIANQVTTPTQTPISTNISSLKLSFTKDLKPGFTSNEVKQLQIFLNSNSDTKIAKSGPGSPGKETNFFGSLTKKSVIKFQEKYAKDILTPWGLTKGTGFVGKTTRIKMMEISGK
ncbi:MAG: putative Ig domain-containing protein [Candidatus Paceibacterota bacterium]